VVYPPDRMTSVVRAGSATLTIIRMKEIELIYKEEFTEKEEARARELYLKSATGRRFLKNILF